MSKLVMVTVEVLVFTALIGTIFDSLGSPHANMSIAAKALYALIGLLVIIGFVLGIMKTMGVKIK